MELSSFEKKNITHEALFRRLYGHCYSLQVMWGDMDAYQHVAMELNYASPQDLANNLSNLRQKYKE